MTLKRPTQYSVRDSEHFVTLDSHAVEIKSFDIEGGKKLLS